MVTLSLLRHAKSSWSDASLGDFDRPLTSRGQKAAPRMGRHIGEMGLVPDLVLCSTAARARETLERALPELTPAPEVRYDDQLYHASARTMLDLVRETSDTIRHLMLVGHNPGLHVLALEMTRSGAPQALDQLAAKFPTAALAVFTFAGAWRDVAAGTGELSHFMVPRALPD